MCTRPFRNVCVYILMASFLFVGVVQTSAAAVIGTQTAIAVQQRQQDIAQIQATLARDDVRAQMIMMGVDPAQAEARVEALTDRELVLLKQEIAQLPAGGGVLEVIGIVFIVLLILEVTGVINIFKKV